MRKFTKSEIKKLKKYWKQLQKLQNDFDFRIGGLERAMQYDLKMKDLEFFMSDGGYCGIGNIPRTIKLIHAEELEEK